MRRANMGWFVIRCVAAISILILAWSAGCQTKPKDVAPPAASQAPAPAPVTVETPMTTEGTEPMGTDMGVAEPDIQSPVATATQGFDRRVPLPAQPGGTKKPKP